MNCVMCGRSEHMSLSTFLIPTGHKGMYLSFVVCGDCHPSDVDGWPKLEPGKNYEAMMTVTNEFGRT